MDAEIKRLHGSLFSGIGGFDIVAQKAGFENAFHCEIKPMLRDVLGYYWKNAESYGDITETDFTVWRNRIEILSGGFPCQDISKAGKKEGLKGENSRLFYELIRATDECRPKYSVFENVSRVREYLPEIISAYSSIGYCLQWTTVRASWFGFPHQRERIFGIAYNTHRLGWYEIQDKARSIEKTLYEASQRQSCRADGREIRLENYTEFLRLDDGLPKKLASQCIEAFGNAIIPEIAHLIFKILN